MKKLFVLLALVTMVGQACGSAEDSKKKPAKKEVIPEGSTDADREVRPADTVQRRD